MREERKTQIANEILINLLMNYKERQIRVFLATLNKAATKYYAIEKDNSEMNECGESLSVDITLDFYKKYGGKGNDSKEVWKELINSINIPIIIYNGNKKSAIYLIEQIDFYEDEEMFTVYFNDDFFEYVILLRESNYTIIDLEELNLLSGKYEIGVYLSYWQFVEQGKRIFTLEGCKNFFGYESDNTKEFMRSIRKAIKSVNNKLNYSIDAETQTKNKRITHINVVFPRGKRKV
jgi:hypothetical protein